VVVRLASAPLFDAYDPYGDPYAFDAGSMPDDPVGFIHMGHLSGASASGGVGAKLRGSKVLGRKSVVRHR
jgi:hypothetical protein